MCYQVEVLEYNEDKAIITVGESKFIAYHDTDVSVEEGFTDFWDFTNDCHYTRPNGKHEVDARTILNSLYVITFEDSDTDERLDIHIPNDRISKDLTRAIEDAIALAAIAKKEQELENAANSFDWSVGHVSHYYI
jgi:hypothetical protein